MKRSRRQIERTDQKGLALLDLGLNPVLLGRSGEGLKRPLHKKWQQTSYSREQVARWPVGHNVAIRCGRQANGRYLLVFDFDEEAGRVFPAWWYEAAPYLPALPVVVTSGRGYHVYVYTTTPVRGQTLAARRERANGPFDKACIEVGSAGRWRLVKFIETLGTGRLVVTAGSRHPSGECYCFLAPVGEGEETADQTTAVTPYAQIPLLPAESFEMLLALARCFDQRPQPGQRRLARRRSRTEGRAKYGATNCLDYARRYLGATEQVEPNGDIRFLGWGGLLVTADGRGWYLHSEGIGGGLADLVAWHKTLIAGESNG
jgi:hypothetical protein